jgi:RNA polymerase sigma factor (sigma-70 family)
MEIMLMNLEKRREIIRGVRRNDARSIDIYSRVILGIIEINLKGESNNLYNLNKHRFPDMESEDFQSIIHFEVSRVSLGNETSQKLFELTEDLGEFKAYTFGIFHNVVRSTTDKWIRRNKNREKLQEKRESEDFLIDECLPKNYSAESKEKELYNYMLEIAHDEVRKLEPSDRKKVLELWLNGVTQEDICRLLEMNRNTVSSHIHRGKKFLRKQIRDRLDYEGGF